MSQASFTGAIHDRLGRLRSDAQWLSAQLENPHHRMVAFLEDRALVSLAGNGAAELATAGIADHRGILILIGRDDGDRLLFAGEVDPASDIAKEARAIDLRSLALQGLLPDAQLGLLAQARSLLGWHGRNGFCANCGTPTVIADAGYRRHCPACGTSHFPRTDPVAIMIVRDGSRLLLGRQPNFQPGMYSALAGFIEPGETIEDAARREIFEESGIVVGAVRYLSSQPWPFPSSLMIGLIGEASSTTIEIDFSELEDVRWFDEAEVRLMLAGRHPDGLQVPQPIAIAHHLVLAALSQPPPS